MNLKYGAKEIPLTLDKTAVELRHREPQKSIDPGKLKNELTRYLEGLEHPVRNAGIVVSDKTRLCEYPVYLPLLTSVLLDRGIRKEDITFYIAYGTHPQQTEEESLDSYGDTFRQFRFVHHNSRDEERLVTLGTTTRGTEVKILKALLQHDLLIAFGAILHHYFAGFGGGRKLFFPGLAGYDGILKNHSLFLDFEKRALREGCLSGNLDTNPLAIDLEEIHRMLPAHLEIHAILNSRKEVTEIHMGSDYAFFGQVCRRYDHFFRSDEAGQFDMVVASAGGYPKDINFIQAHKSIHNAAAFVRDGGRLIIFAACRDGIGNKAFTGLLRLGGEEGIFEAMEVRYRNNAGTALAMLQKSKRIRIHFVTSLDDETCRLMGAVRTAPEEVQGLIDQEQGEIAWIGNASLLYR